MLYLGRPFLEPMAGTQLWQAAHSAMRKIRATLSESALEYLERFPQSVPLHERTDSAITPSKAEIIDDLTIAIEDCKAVHITYQSQQATEPATRDVYPYGLVRHKGSLYLVAFAPEHDEIRHYKVDRIEAVEISSFIVPAAGAISTSRTTWPARSGSTTATTTSPSSSSSCPPPPATSWNGTGTRARS